MKTIKSVACGVLCLWLVACSSGAPPVNTLEQALNGDHRSAANKARDTARHPVETLTFLQVEPQHTVVEIWPGGKGWYTEVLAPYLRNDGKLYAAHFHPEAAVPYLRKSLQVFAEKLATNPSAYGKVETTILQPGLLIDMAPSGSVDRVLTFRNVHNWMKMGYAQEIFDASFVALKPGGLLGVIEHRAKVGTSMDDMIRSGYVTEAQVKVYAVAAGFEFVAASEVNANPDDIKEYPSGVWSLPPTLRMGDENKAYYESIGESDRMTLMFKKPE